MRVAFLLSTKGGSPLIVGLQNGLTQLGHEVVHYDPLNKVDLVVICNQSAHTFNYQYPRFLKHDQPFVFLDNAEYGYFKRLPELGKFYANAFSVGSMAHDTKNSIEQLRLKAFLEGKSFPYFLREFSKYLSYPSSYHPIDYPLYYASECSIRPDREQYLNRPMDLFSSWGASHPWRWQLTQCMRECAAIKSEVLVIEENGTPRMEQSKYFDCLRQAKTSVSYDGYGSSSFRLTEALVRTLLLVGPLSIVRHAPLIDGVHCLEYKIVSSGETFHSTNLCDVLRRAIRDPEWAFVVHEAGYYHCYEHYTEKATAAYLLSVVEKHDWTKPTQIDL